MSPEQEKALLDSAPAIFDALDEGVTLIASRSDEFGTNDPLLVWAMSAKTLLDAIKEPQT